MRASSAPGAAEGRYDSPIVALLLGSDRLASTGLVRSCRASSPSVHVARPAPCVLLSCSRSPPLEMQRGKSSRGELACRELNRVRCQYSAAALLRVLQTPPPREEGLRLSRVALPRPRSSAPRPEGRSPRFLSTACTPPGTPHPGSRSNSGKTPAWRCRRPPVREEEERGSR